MLVGWLKTMRADKRYISVDASCRAFSLPSFSATPPPPHPTPPKKAAGAASGSREARFLNTLSLRRGVPVTRKALNAALELSLRRMGVERLDLVQLCWWVHRC